MPWLLEAEPEQVRPIGDGERWRYVVHDGAGERRDVFVELSGTVAACDPSGLPSPIDEAARTLGRSVIEASVDRLEPPAVITVTTHDVVVQPRHGSYGPGDRVYVCDDGQWRPARVVRLAEPDEALDVPAADPPRRSDVIWVSRDGEPQRYRYADVRPLPPDP